MFGKLVDHQFAPHEHDTWSIGWVVSGANHFRRERQHHTAPSGTVCVVNPSEIHTGGGGSMSYWSVMPSQALLDLAFPHASPDDLLIARAVLSESATTDAARRLFQVSTVENCCLSMQAAAVDMLRAVLGQGARRLSAEPPASRLAVNRAVQYLHDNLDRNVSLAELSQACDVSAFSLCREFASSLGVSPGAWVRSRRIARAQDLLRRGADLCTVAGQCGFSDQAHMTRLFRSVIGCTPAEWRRAA